jgi:AcrR family transcriptional regulator
VAKQTIYRWWPSKGHIVAECLSDGILVSEGLVPPDTGDVRADAIAWLEHIFHVLEQPEGEALMRSLIAAAAEQAAVGRQLRDSLGATVLAERLARPGAGYAGDGDAPAAELIEALAGAVLLRALSRMPVQPGDAETLVNAVLAGWH